METYRDRATPDDALVFLRSLNHGEQLRWLLEMLYEIRGDVEELKTTPQAVQQPYEKQKMWKK